MSQSGENDTALWGELNQQTAKIDWPELERHFARGVLVRVDASLDLVEVALQIVRDNTAEVQPWMEQGLVVRATDDHARQWSKGEGVLWAVVASPWVLVQQRGE